MHKLQKLIATFYKTPNESIVTNKKLIIERICRSKNFENVHSFAYH